MLLTRTVQSGAMNTSRIILEQYRNICEGVKRVSAPPARLRPRAMPDAAPVQDRAYLMTTVGSAYKVEPPTGTAFMPVGGEVGS